MKKAFETAILTELYPMSKIDIFVEVLQSDGGTNNFTCTLMIQLLINFADVSISGVTVCCDCFR